MFSETVLPKLLSIGKGTLLKATSAKLVFVYNTRRQITTQYHRNSRLSRSKFSRNLSSDRLET